MDPIELERLLHGRNDPAAEPDWESLAPGDPDPDPPAVPPDQGRAAWHNRRAATAGAKADQIADLFNEEIARLTERRDQLLDRWLREQEWHERAVQAWHRENVKTVGKTVEFPYGPRSELRGQPGKLVIQDEDKLRAFLAEHGNEDGERLEDLVWVRQEPKFMVSALKSLTQVPKKEGGREPNEPAKLVLKTTGETVPGLVAIALPDRWQKGKS
jgi:hypothetical protein